jgi:hypothetical integral membrane protein (TIGR02206 family)
VDVSPGHWVPVCVIAAAAAALAAAARRYPGRWVSPVAFALGFFVLGTEVVWWGYQVATGTWSVANAGLPLHICDAATLVAAAALWARRQVLVDLLYFWACAGTVQALVTPWVTEPFPHLLYWQYYAGHGGVVVAALLLVVGLRMAPGPGAVPRALVLTAAFTAVAGLADWAFGADYMYLRQPPPVHSLLDVMGPWPWYLVAGVVLAVVLFVLLYAPFWAVRRLSASSVEPAVDAVP